jgi:hypothetical protein
MLFIILEKYTKLYLPGIQFSLVMQEKEAIGPEVVKIFHFDTQFDREVWCI